MVVVYTEKNRYIDTKDGRELNFSIVFLIELTERERDRETEGLLIKGNLCRFSSHYHSYIRTSKCTVYVHT